MSATATHVLYTAAKEDGHTENPAGSNRTKYGLWYGMNGQPWCAIWISWVFWRSSALDLLPGGKRAYTPTFANDFKRAGRWGTEPKIGAIVFYDFPDNVTRIQHVGLVAKILTDGSILAWEGNTSGNDSGSQDNGGMVALKHRSRHIVGYGYPDYEGGDVSATPHRHVAGGVTTDAAKGRLHAACHRDGNPLTGKALFRHTWLPLGSGAWVFEIHANSETTLKPVEALIDKDEEMGRFHGVPVEDGTHTRMGVASVPEVPVSCSGDCKDETAALRECERLAQEIITVTGNVD